MNRPSLSAIFRRATARADSGISADDVARLAAGEHLGQRHAAAVEALAGSSPAFAAFRAVQGMTLDAHDLLRGVDGDVRVLNPRVRQAPVWPAAMAAGLLGVAAVGGLLWQSKLSPGTDPTLAAHPAATDDVIFNVSYEADALAAASGEEAIFVDEFGI
jgi:hypothetical protein